MRKTNDKKILEKLKEGKTQKEIAEYFGVSSAAICKRVKRLLPPPESFNSLTDKEQRFCIEVAKGKTQTQAVMNSYEVVTRKSAKVIGSQLMTKPEIQMAIDELMDYHGIDRSYRIKRLGDHVRHVDPVVSLKALDLSWKLDGSYAPLKNINYNTSYEDVRREYDRLKAELAEAEAAGEDSEH